MATHYPTASKEDQSTTSKEDHQSITHLWDPAQSNTHSWGKNTPPLKFAPAGGYKLHKAETPNQKKKRKNKQDPSTPIITPNSHTWFPDWNGNLSDFQTWLLTHPKSNALTKTNTNSLAAKIGPYTLNFYTSSRSFQITKLSNAKAADFSAFVKSTQEWLTAHLDPDFDMMPQLLHLLDEATSPSHSKTSAAMTPDQLLEKQYLREIRQHVQIDKDKSLWEIRLIKVPLCGKS
jgi:hypothetical protein